MADLAPDGVSLQAKPHEVVIKEPGLITPVSIKPIEVVMNCEATGFAGGKGEADLQLLLFEGGGAVRLERRNTLDTIDELVAMPWVEISSEIARQARVGSGDLVRVISLAGEMQALVY